MTSERLESPLLAALRSWPILAGCGAGLICGLGAWLDPGGFYPAYLIGYLFWLGISLGSLAIAMLHHLTGGGWGVPIRRILESAYGNLLLLAVLFVPVALGAPSLYIWARPEAVARDEHLQWKVEEYLNLPFWQTRAAVYFAIWVVLAAVLSRWSAREASARQRRAERRLIRLSGAGLVLWGLTVTFASVDWVMSLEPHWFSSMFGVLFMGAQGVSALSLAILAAIALRHEPPWASSLTESRLGDLASLLLAFVMFWSYVSFMQFLIIWSGNLPEEAPWYLKRNQGGWDYVAGLLATLHFVVPFLLLLQRQVKRDPQRLVWVAGLLLVMRLIDLSWLVLPTFSPGRLWLNPWLLVTPLAVGGFWLTSFAWQLASRAAIPVYDPSLAKETLDGHSAPAA